MNSLKASTEFKIGKHSIGYIDSDFKDRFGDASFASAAAVGTFQTLARHMTDDEIEKELKPGMCTLGDVLAFLQNPPEGTKDGNWNIFYPLENPSFVVGVRWGSVDGGWRVGAWGRGGSGWGAGGRVFSPATDSLGTGSYSESQTLETLDPMTRIAIALERIADMMQKCDPPQPADRCPHTDERKCGMCAPKG